MTKPQGGSSLPVRKGGRASGYRRDVTDEICLRISEGEALKVICREKGMPASSTFLGWVLDDIDGLADRYARACMMRAEMWADETVEIAETDPDPNRARLRIDTRKWFASKLLPKYRDRVQTDVNVSGTITQKHEVNWDAIPTEKLERLRLAWQEAVGPVIEGEVVREDEDE